MAQAPGPHEDELGAVAIRAGARQFRLGERPEGVRQRALSYEAIRWSYVLRARERWVDSAEARGKHEQDARRTLANFGLGEDDLRAIAESEQVIVHLDYQAEAIGWAARLFPWEYVLAAATRRLRAGSNRPFVILRELFPGGAPRAVQAGMLPRVLYVQSAPGRLSEGWDFEAEHDRLRRGVGASVEIVVLKNPTLAELRARIEAERPALLHLSGFDNVQGLRALRDAMGLQAQVDIRAALLDAPDQDGDGYARVTLGRLLKDERALQDGYLMTSPQGRPCVVTALELAEALGGLEHPPWLAGVSVANSGARTAALLVGEGAALNSVGFQGDLDNALADYFFELLYRELMRLQGHVAGAFGQSWARARLEPHARRATGITLWSSWRLDAPVQAPPPEAAPAQPRRGGDPSLDVQPAQELNYAVLHNTRQGLFERFVIDRNGAEPGSRISVDVELQLGVEKATYSKTFTVAEEERWNLTDEIHLPLTAGLVRSAREAVNSSVTAQLTLDREVLRRETHRIRLLPVDQWRDNAKDGQWLPSFVLPRDPAVMRAVQQAQRYVRVLRDDPTAGFEGYQAAPDAGPAEEQLTGVDLQVQAIWAALLHEWRLGYINPPPAYSAKLDSQRLRTPSVVERNAAGTCIDLALLLAACLELVDIYPVVFLLEGHALPGYWRHHSYHDAFRQAVYPERDDEERMRAARMASSAEIQEYPWQARGMEAHREIAARIRARQLVPIETVRLTENSGFVEAVEAGTEALAQAGDFHSLLDIVQARVSGITPLPIVEDVQ